MAYTAWSVVFGEQPSAAKWNILGTNDASFNDGTGLNNGSTQQIVSTLSNAVSTGTTTIPLDDTIPQNTEGDQYITLAITPKSTTNLLVIDALLDLSHSAAAAFMIVALFQDTTANALAATKQLLTTATGSGMVGLKHTMTAGTTSATTFKIRAGSSSAGTTTLNGQTGGRLLGAITHSSIVITEYKA